MQSDISDKTIFLMHNSRHYLQRKLNYDELTLENNVNFTEKKNMQ